MIVKTRYRDVPYSEIRNCTAPPNEAGEAIWEQEQRGKETEIIAPPTTAIRRHEWLCDGPFYFNAISYRGRYWIDCIHRLEIGD